HTRSTRDWSSDVCSSDLGHCGSRVPTPGGGETRRERAVLLAWPTSSRPWSGVAWYRESTRCREAWVLDLGLPGYSPLISVATGERQCQTSCSSTAARRPTVRKSSRRTTATCAPTLRTIGKP